MNLLNDFFKILSVEETENKFIVKVELNAAHEIYKGHFPGNPVLPGVCMVQMMKEIMNHLFKRKFTMTEASQLKFLAIINPVEVQSLYVEIVVLKAEGKTMILSGRFFKADLVFLRYRVTFTIQD